VIKRRAKVELSGLIGGRKIEILSHAENTKKREGGNQNLEGVTTMKAVSTFTFPGGGGEFCQPPKESSRRSPRGTRQQVDRGARVEGGQAP